MSFIPRPHEIYKHFKGNLYQITAIAEHTETGETLVVYQAMYGDFKTYARPLTMFISPVDREKYPDAVQEFRFELQGPDAARQKAETGGTGLDAGTDVRSQRDSAGSGEQSRSGSAGDVKVSVQNRSDPGEQPAEERTVHSSPQEYVYPEPDEKSTEYDRPAGHARPESEGETEELNIDPLVLEFLDADSYEQRLNILAGLHHRITDDMITTMAIACDLEISDGDIEERYESLKTCLLTMERYECNRLR